MSIQPLNDINGVLAKVSQGDEQAFALLFNTYKNTLGGYILRITEQDDLVQEIVQDVFLKIWLNRSSLSDIECFKAYLLVVARNHAFNCLKKMARERKREEIWMEAALAQQVTTEEETNALDYGGIIDAVIERLPPQQKKVYLLSHMTGMKHKEIARELNIATETVKKHMLLALRFIKNNITQVTSILIAMIFLYKS